MANDALIVLGVLCLIGGVGAFMYAGTVQPITIHDDGSMTRANPGAYEGLGLILGIGGVLLIIVGAVVGGKEVQSTARFIPPHSSIVHEFETFCPSCGTTIGYPGQTQCKACGRNLTSTKVGKREKPLDQGDAEASGTKFCRHCGKTILADSAFCEHCGNAV